MSAEDADMKFFYGKCVAFCSKKALQGSQRMTVILVSFHVGESLLK